MKAMDRIGKRPGLDIPDALAHDAVECRDRPDQGRAHHEAAAEPVTDQPGSFGIRPRGCAPKVVQRHVFDLVESSRHVVTRIAHGVSLLPPASATCTG